MERSGRDRVGRPLVIGYGNTLRRDDGVGVRAAEVMATDPRLSGVAVLAVHQLTLELAIDVSEASYVVFIDADPSVVPGVVEVRSLPGEPASMGGSESGASSHHVGILELLGLARELTGRAPAAAAVAIGVDDLGMGEGLSPAVEATLPQAVDTVAGLVAGFAGPRAARTDLVR